jgi:hypothetical protein
MCGLPRIVLPDWSTIQRYSLLHQCTFRTRSTEIVERHRKSLCTDREDLQRNALSWRYHCQPLEEDESGETRRVLVAGGSGPSSRSMVYSYYPYTDPSTREARARRKTFLLPYLNVEVLKRNPATLFGLLYNRTHYAPENWVPYDNRQLILNWESGYFDAEYSSHQTLINHDICAYILRPPPSRPTDLSTAFP